MAIGQNNLYELTPNEFEKLCAEILKTQGFERVQLVGGPKDQGVDIVGESKGHKVAVQVKHTKHLSTAALRRIIDQVLAGSYQPQELVIMTSAPLSPSLKSSVQSLQSGISVRIIGPTEILQALKKHPEIRHSQVGPARQRTARQRLELVIGVIGGISSIAGLLLSGMFYFGKPAKKPQLRERIETVESAMGSLKELERQLTDIKKDMVETEKAARTIEQEYAKAKELEKLTAEQYEALKKALLSQSWQKTAIDYGLGFLLGIAASLIANVIYSRVRQHRALRKEV